jgi:hypothetical protein
MIAPLTHLDRLEAEAIDIFREVAATFAKPVMLYSVGKDSSVLLHLAMKAFYPAKPPFPFLHVDTTWKFREMIAFRDAMAAKLGFDLLVHINEDGVRDNINPFDHGSNTHTHVMKTVALLLGNFTEFGEQLRLGWTSKRAIAHNISNYQIDEVLDAAIAAGAYGGKISGAGGGGFVMISVPPERRPLVLNRLKNFPGQIFNRVFTQEGARAWKVR